jgi:hypothetical protein
VPRLCELYPGIYLTTEEKARKILSQGREMRRYCTRHRTVVEIWTVILQVRLGVTDSMTCQKRNPNFLWISFRFLMTETRFCDEIILQTTEGNQLLI